MIDSALVSAVLVTKGDHDLSEIYDSLAQAGIEDVVTWDNSQRENLICYGRYAGIAEAKHDWIYHQDDDLISPVAEILAEVDPEGDRWQIVCNNRADEQWRLTAIGAVFHRDLADCFDDYIERHGFDADFCRVCDVVFAYQWPYRRITLGYRDLPWGTAPDRMYHQRDHMMVRERALDRVAAIVGAFPPEL